jgi:rhodanese-related sulfurtransferase
LNIGIASPSFPVWSGFFVDPDLPIALVVESEAQAQRTQLELARIGFDQVVGFITADDLDEKHQITQIGASDFLSSLESPQRPVVLDVRSDPEWSLDHLEGAIHVPLPQLPRRIAELSRKEPLTVVCASGYRSSIAGSLLESKGFTRLSNVAGGMQAVRHAPKLLPATSEPGLNFLKNCRPPSGCATFSRSSAS